MILNPWKNIGPNVGLLSINEYEMSMPTSPHSITRSRDSPCPKAKWQTSGESQPATPWGFAGSMSRRECFPPMPPGISGNSQTTQVLLKPLWIHGLFEGNPYPKTLSQGSSMREY